MADEKNAPDGASGEVRPGDAPTGAEIKMPSEAFAKRIEEAKASERKALLKKFGAESEADVERRLKAAKDAELASLSEKDRLSKQIEELSPRAKRAEHLEKRFAENVQKRIDALPEGERALVEKFGGETPEQRDAFLDYREAMRAEWDAEHGKKPPAPANTAPPPNAPRGADAPSMFTKWQEVERQNPMLGRIFYDSNKAAIERDRPA